VIWSCHVRIDQPNNLARTAWEFLPPDVQQADAYVFSRAAYCWEGLDRARLAVIAPCIDAFAPKNQTLEPPTVNAILRMAGILEDQDTDVGSRCFGAWTGVRAGWCIGLSRSARSRSTSTTRTQQAGDTGVGGVGRPVAATGRAVVAGARRRAAPAA
jgi:hypothetical protein